MGKRKREGRIIKTRTPMDTVGYFIMPTRTGSSLYFKDRIDLAECEKYIKRKREEGLRGFGMLHVFIAAYLRTVSQRPAINRFISGQRTFARNDVQVCLTIKKSLSLNAPETVVKLFAEPTFTAEDVYHKMGALIEENKQDGDTNDMDGAARALAKVGKLPPIFLKTVVGFLKMFDYFGLLPKSLIALSPFHCSMFITSMGSLGIPPIFHHLYDFGNCPVFISTGAKYKECILQKDGTVEEHKFMDFTCVLDERICDGQYYASSFKLLQSILQHPDQLDTPPAEVVPDID